jgi:hypothetical protein
LKERSRSVPFVTAEPTIVRSINLVPAGSSSRRRRPFIAQRPIRPGRGVVIWL